MAKGSIVLSGVVLLLIGLLTILTIYQGPSMDDFVGRYYFDSLGYIDGVKAYLSHGNSRYFSLPVFIGASASYFLIEQYFIVLIAGMIGMLACVYYFVNTIAFILFRDRVSSKQLYLVTGFLFLFFCSIVRELPSFIYWFATTITYLVPFGLFLILSAMVLQVKNNSNVSKIQGKSSGISFIPVLILFLLKIMVGGSNELILFYSMYLTFLLALYEFTAYKKLSKLTWLMIAMDILILMAVISIPGASSRSHNFSAKQSIAFSTVGAGFRVYQLLLHIFSSALFWILMVFVVWLSKYVHPAISEWVVSRKKSGLLFDLLLVIFPVFFFIFFIRHFGGEVVPPRAENIMICISALLMYSAIFLWSVKNLHKQSPSIIIIKLFPSDQFIHSYKYMLAFILLLSPLGYGILQNLLFLPAHKRVLDKRVSIIENAILKGEPSVRIPSYKPLMDQELEKQFGKKGADFFRAEFSIPPSFSYFKDDPNNPSNNYAYAEYYKIDSMIVDTSVVKKWSLTDKLLFGAQ